MNTPVLVRREEFGVGRKQLEISNEELGQHRTIPIDICICQPNSIFHNAWNIVFPYFHFE